MTTKVALIGAGYMAREHAQAFCGIPGAELVGIFSRTFDKAESLAAEFGIEQICTSVDDLYARTGADLVVVTVRELAMHAIARASFVHPWVVLLEKPAGHHYAEAQEILKAARDNGARVYVALNRRNYASTLRALELIATSGGGRRLICVSDQQDMAAAAARGHPAEVVRNFMFANSIHVIDYLRVFGRGRIVSVRPVIPWDPKEPGFVISHVEFESGDIGLYEGVWNGPGPWAAVITDSQLRLEMRPLEALTLQKRGERLRTNVELDRLDADFKPGLRVQALHAVEAARGGMPAALATLDDATESMRLCAEIFGQPC